MKLTAEQEQVSREYQANTALFLQIITSEPMPDDTRLRLVSAYGRVIGSVSSMLQIISDAITQEGTSDADTR